MDVKKSFVLYSELKEVVDVLSDEESGNLFRAILNYVNGEEVEVLPSIRLAWIPIKQALERDSLKYEERCKKNAENQRKRWEKIKALEEKSKSTTEYERIQPNTNVYERIQTYTNGTDNDNNNDIENENDNGNEIENENENDIKKENYIKEKRNSYPKDTNGVEDKSTKDIDIWFEEFWSLYPKKNGKKKCYQAFKNIKNIRKVYPKIKIALLRDMQSQQWTKDNGQYIPNPLTWIHGEYWNNEGVKAFGSQYGDINEGWNEA